MDPFALLGVSPDATVDELAAAYRRLAKQWHPDHRPSPDAPLRMAQINAAYDAARAALGQPPRAAAAPGSRGARTRPAARRGHGGPPAAWRRALGPELTRALHDDEPVLLVVRTSTWASPQARLAVTDRRLLWLREDAVGDRVRSLRFEAVAEVEQRLAWPRRRTATVRVRDAVGRRTTFADLAPHTAARVVELVRRRAA